MAIEKCCCNCLHCARWQTSKGVECHCDLTDRYLGYIEVMSETNCLWWEKETKWELEEAHNNEVYKEGYNQALEDAITECRKTSGEYIDTFSDSLCAGLHMAVRIAERLKIGGKNDD